MISVQCAICKHSRGDNTCEAFPKGIPEVILTGVHDHSEPYDGDHGIRFEEDKSNPMRELVDDGDDPD